MQREELTEIPGVERWSYGAFQQDTEDGSISVPLQQLDHGPPPS